MVAGIKEDAWKGSGGGECHCGYRIDDGDEVRRKGGVLQVKRKRTQVSLGFSELRPSYTIRLLSGSNGPEIQADLRPRLYYILSLLGHTPDGGFTDQPQYESHVVTLLPNKPVRLTANVHSTTWPTRGVPPGKNSSALCTYLTRDPSTPVPSHSYMLNGAT
jgi:hypothetical protein